MADVDPIPEHLHTVTPRLVVAAGADAIRFYCRAFGAVEVGERFNGPDGELIHAELRIGDSIVMITEDRGASERNGPPAAIMATYWEDVDACWQRAIRAGAEVIHPLADHFYGERGGRLGDPYGQQWMLSQRLEVLSADEIDARAKRAFETN